MVKHFNVTVKGRVQGVSYRWYAYEQAKELGIKGFVENRPDGSVYVEAEGQVGALDQFKERLKKGPRQAWVKAIIANQDQVQHYSDFEIRLA